MYVMSLKQAENRGCRTHPSLTPRQWWKVFFGGFSAGVADTVSWRKKKKLPPLWSGQRGEVQLPQKVLGEGP